MSIFISSLLVFVIDRITKILVINFVSYPIKVLGDFFILSPTKNYGVSFGLFSGYPGLVFWITLAICVFLVVYAVLLKEKSRLFKIGIGLFIGGALGNLVDRPFGGVIDFISIGIGNLRWPTFNISDIAIVVGAILIILGKSKTKDIN
ncbi:TPA: signal peptidase II [bacterium]|nr:signal peptidase II [bacterium]